MSLLRHPRATQFASAILVAVAYVIAGKTGLMLASDHPSATAVWAPTGIAIAAFLLYGNTMWLPVFIGAFVVNATTAGSLFTTFSIATGNTLEGFVGAMLIRRYARWPDTFDHVRSTVAFAGVCLIAPFVSATIGLLALSFAGFAPWERFEAIWLTWWVGDAVGAVVITPLIVLLFREPHMRRISPARDNELVLLWLCTLMLGLVAFAAILPGQPPHLPIGFICIPCIIWSGVRFGSRMTAMVTFVLSLIAIVATLRGLGPYGNIESGEALWMLQLFMGFMATTGLVLSAAMVQNRKAEIAYKISQQRFHDIFNASKDGIAFNSLSGMFLSVNSSFAELTGYPKETLISGMRYQDLSPPEYLELETAKMGELLRTGEAVEFEKEYIRKDGTKLFALVTLFLVEASENTSAGVGVIVKDITSRKREEIAKNQFVSLAAHQLRTPLSAVRWAFSSVAMNAGAALPPEEKAALEGGQKAAQMMADTIETLLLLSKIEAGRVRPQLSDVSLPEIFHDLAEDFERQKGDASPAVVFGNAAAFRVRTDPHMLKQILAILLNNAGKYSPAGSTIRVRALMRDGGVSIEVKDEGIGIPASEHHRVFTLFYRGKNANARQIDGTGLGLYLADVLAGLLMADLSFQSDEGKGTTFALTLPPPLD